MSAIKFTVSESTEETARKLEISFDFGDNLEEAVAKFGADAVYKGFVADGKVGVQAVARRMLKTNKPAEGENSERPYTDEEIFAKVAEYVPGTRSERTSDPIEKMEKLLGKLTETQKAELLAKIQNM